VVVIYCLRWLRARVAFIQPVTQDFGHPVDHLPPPQSIGTGAKWLDENCGADGWAMTPAGRGVVNDTVGAYFLNATLAAGSSPPGAPDHRSKSATGRSGCAMTGWRSA
jgi:hypothetical protein